MPQLERRPYALPRNPNESGRLDAQHKLYVDNLGYYIHPHVAASLPPNPKIADVATGTGAWMIGAAPSLPGAKFVGLDMSPAQFRKGSLPANCEFQVLNILEPIPQELQGRFDVVHVRLLVVGLTRLAGGGNDWDTVAAHVMQMLKPGGWFQWCEADFEHVDVLQTKGGSSREAHCELWRFCREVMQKHGKLQGDVQALAQTVRKAGYVNCHEDMVSSDRLVERRREGSDIEHAAIVAIAKDFAVNLKSEHDRSEQDVAELIKRCDDEVAKGEPYWRWNIHVVVGQKPAGS